MTAAPSLTPTATPTWRDACLLVVALVTFLSVSDVQGVMFHRDEFQTLGRWAQWGATYVFGAGLLLWQWEWVARVFLSWRFLVVAGAAIAAIAASSSRHEAAQPAAGVSLLRTGERERLPILVHPLSPVGSVAWTTPATSHAAASAAEEEEAAAQDSQFRYDLPEGWSELPSTGMRPVNLRVGGDARAECYLSSLPGQAGGVLDNVNRWRTQMGLAAIEADALAKLPRSKLLGREAVLVELEGTFTGMSGEPIPNARMVGAIAALPAVMLFLKMTGPSEVVQRERAGFDKVLTSLRLPGDTRNDTKDEKTGAGKDTKSNSDPKSNTAATAKADQGPPPVDHAEGLRWTLPATWQRGRDRPMRVVTMGPPGAPEVECYVAILPGAAGGVLDNVNRWRDQFAAEKLTQAQVDALPKVRVLGADAPIVEAAGTFTGMGSTSKAGYGLLGTMVALDDRMVFIKMTGPQAQVQGERESFLAFCRSLGRE